MRHWSQSICLLLDKRTLFVSCLFVCWYFFFFSSVFVYDIFNILTEDRSQRLCTNSSVNQLHGRFYVLYFLHTFNNLRVRLRDYDPMAENHLMCSLHTFDVHLNLSFIKYIIPTIIHYFFRLFRRRLCSSHSVTQSILGSIVCCRYRHIFFSMRTKVECAKF